MYREPEKPPGSDRDDLERMAEEGRLKRAGEQASRDALAAAAALEARESQKLEDAVIGQRFAERASRSFGWVVDAQGWLFFLYLAGIAAAIVAWMNGAG